MDIIFIVYVHCVCCFSVNVRYEMLQETVSAYRREISALQERSQKMAATAQRHEHIIHTMSQDLRQANEKLALEEVRKKRGFIILKLMMMRWMDGWMDIN